MVVQKDNNTMSPLVIMGLIIVLSIYLAFVDPSKWMFALSLIPSFVLFIIIMTIDNKK